jgi:hypothetical protein
MRQKTLIALAVITAPVLIAAIVVPSRHSVVSKPLETGPVFPALKDWLAGATKLTVISAGGPAVTLTRAAPVQPGEAGALPVAGWGVPDKGGYPVMESAIRPVLSGLLALHTVEAKTERPSLYARLDVEDPTAAGKNPAGKDAKAKLVELDNGDGANIVKLIIGRHRADPAVGGPSAVYVRKPEDERAWAAEPAFEIPDDALSWVDKRIAEIDPDKIQSMTITPTGGPPLVLDREKTDDKLAIRDLPKGATTRSETPGADVAAGLRFLDLLDVRKASDLTAPPTGTAELATFDGLHATVTFFDQPAGGPWLEITAKGDGDAAKQADEIDKRTGGWAYRVTSERAKLLQSKLADLLTPPSPKPAEAPAKPEAEPAGAEAPAKPHAK